MNVSERSSLCQGIRLPSETTAWRKSMSRSWPWLARTPWPRLSGLGCGGALRCLEHRTQGQGGLRPWRVSVFLQQLRTSPSLVNWAFPMFCVDPVWDTDRAHDLINQLRDRLPAGRTRGDSAAAALAPESVDFPGIEYESVGYGVQQRPPHSMTPPCPKSKVFNDKCSPTAFPATPCA